MSIQLLAIVEAESRADALIDEAKRRKEERIAQALAEREKALSSLEQPRLSLEFKPPQQDTKGLRSKAKQKQAIKRILEEIDAAA